MKMNKGTNIPVMNKVYYIIIVMLLVIGCSGYESKGLLHPSQIENSILVEVHDWDKTVEIWRYYSLNDSTFYTCTVHEIYKELYKVGDTINKKQGDEKLIKASE